MKLILTHEGEHARTDKDIRNYIKEQMESDIVFSSNHELAILILRIECLKNDIEKITYQYGDEEKEVDVHFSPEMGEEPWGKGLRKSTEALRKKQKFEEKVSDRVIIVNESVPALSDRDLNLEVERFLTQDLERELNVSNETMLETAIYNAGYDNELNLENVVIASSKDEYCFNELMMLDKEMPDMIADLFQELRHVKRKLNR